MNANRGRNAEQGRIVLALGQILSATDRQAIRTSSLGTTRGLVSRPSEPPRDRDPSRLGRLLRHRLAGVRACSLVGTWLLATMCPVLVARAQRLTMPLDGAWEIADSVAADRVPTHFTHTGPVPGLTNLARPAFDDVDRFLSREQLASRIRLKSAPPQWLREYWTGKVEQDRNYFWYRKVFRAPARRDVAVLKVNKAQFGTAVWLNGQKIGEYAGCFSAGFFPLERALRWDEDNTLVIRIGAHPAVLPDTYPTGSDFEKIKWTPGIYDSVSLGFCDNPSIRQIQVAPRLATSEILVQTMIENRGDAVSFELRQQVETWDGGRAVGAAVVTPLRLEADEIRTVQQTVRIPDVRLWSPEDPFLYVLRSSTGGDSADTRFGMREFRFDGATGRAVLNGQPYYLRGSNITLHRFFEDPCCGDLPWNEAWARRLLGELPKQMNWNFFRFCIGPVPDRWLDVCDEVGLLVQNEFFVWTGGPGWYPGYSRTYDVAEMIRQYGDWMRDSWNHPSVAVWDANNETKDAVYGERIIPAVRPLDLSGRPWENSYNPPVSDIDPVEYHPYLMSGGHFGELKFKLSDLETMDGRPRPGQLPSDRNAVIINEYGWLWLNRDGSPTRLTERVYEQLLGPDSTARQRLDLDAYLLAAKTEFWRSRRQYAGVLHFVYLTCSYPGVYTSDHFRDVTRLDLDPAFVDYVGQAFKPLGVYVNFFQPGLAPGTQRAFPVVLINDRPTPLAGTLRLTLETTAGKTLAQTEQPFELPALGSKTLEPLLRIPSDPAGACVLRAAAASDTAPDQPTLSRRWVAVEAPAATPAP